MPFRFTAFISQDKVVCVCVYMRVCVCVHLVTVSQMLRLHVSQGLPVLQESSAGTSHFRQGLTLHGVSFLVKPA